MPLSDKLNEEQCNENEKRKLKLVDLITSEEAFLLVGAGSSKLRGCPLWYELLKIYEKDIADEEAASDVEPDNQFKIRTREIPETDMQYASRLRKRLTPQRFITILDQVLNKDHGYSPGHMAMVTLPFKGIFTTNYDLILEEAVAGTYHGAHSIEVILDEDHKREVFNYLRAINTGEGKYPKIVHIHGHIKHHATIVLCEEEYQHKYGFSFTSPLGDGDGATIDDKKWTLHRKVMWTLIATRRIVYAGFSMSDEYFKLMHEFVGEDLSTYGDDTHILIERIAVNDDPGDIAWKWKNAILLKRKYSIETVFYFDDGADNNLSSFMEELKALVEKKKKRPIQSATEVTLTLPTTGDKNTSERLLSLSKQQFGNED